MHTSHTHIIHIHTLDTYTHHTVHTHIIHIHTLCISSESVYIHTYIKWCFEHTHTHSTYTQYTLKHIIHIHTLDTYTYYTHTHITYTHYTHTHIIHISSESVYTHTHIQWYFQHTHIRHTSKTLGFVGYGRAHSRSYFFS